MNAPDIYLDVLDSMTIEERKTYWKREKVKENISYINNLYSRIKLNKEIINNTKNWLAKTVEQYKAGEIDEVKLRQNLLLGGELINGCEYGNGVTRAEIAQVTRYPLGSEKRRLWYKKG